MHIGIDGIDAESKGKKIKPTRNRQVFLMNICLPHQKTTGEYLLIFLHNVDCHWIAHLNSMSFYVQWKHKPNYVWTVRFKKATQKSLIFWKWLYNVQFILTAKPMPQVSYTIYIRKCSKTTVFHEASGERGLKLFKQSLLLIKKLFTWAHIFEWKRETSVPAHGEWQELPDV